MKNARANVEMSMEGSVLVIRIETADVRPEPSASGKTMTVATTGGYNWHMPKELADRGAYGLNLTLSKRPE